MAGHINKVPEDEVTFPAKPLLRVSVLEPLDDEGIEFFQRDCPEAGGAKPVSAELLIATKKFHEGGEGVGQRGGWGSGSCLSLALAAKRHGCPIEKDVVSKFLMLFNLGAITKHGYSWAQPFVPVRLEVGHAKIQIG